ncbi:hypothetical protein VHA01S_087_00040 [Vibrio halioticoli NBRC 102217]|uniref:DUF2913 domain-containing protein n=1 Tax=Vibrio halioticoli NBRC 102217 TaxID=1219072 RepID=V5F6M8_9VIBR|nr:DUF2913 family protein [Vibrio halioticoli]GAD91364.1 hypothetical protein VHA01S_087_00040 [Vibrio halioticoli NBRC 102217]
MSYATQIETVACHSLLHLEMQKRYTERFIPVEKRNQILVKYLKGMVKSPKYKLAKKDIKTLIQLGRKKGQNLELHIEALRVLEKPTGNNDLENFYFLVKDIERQLSTSVQYTSNFEITRSKTTKPPEIWICHTDLHSCFDKDMELTDTLNWLVSASAAKEEVLLNILSSYSMFTVEHSRNEGDLFLYMRKCRVEDTCEQVPSPYECRVQLAPDSTSTKTSF